MKTLYLYSINVFINNQKARPFLQFTPRLFYVLIFNTLQAFTFLSFRIPFSKAIFTPINQKKLGMENIILQNITSTRLNNPDQKRLTLLAKRRNTTKSELIRHIVSSYIHSESVKSELLTP